MTSNPHRNQVQIVAERCRRDLERIADIATKARAGKVHPEYACWTIRKHLDSLECDLDFFTSEVQRALAPNAEAHPVEGTA